jgi:hypothetical protein
LAGSLALGLVLTCPCALRTKAASPSVCTASEPPAGPGPRLFDRAGWHSYTSVPP